MPISSKSRPLTKHTLVPKLFLQDASFFGLKNLSDIMEDAQSVLLVLKKHNPYKPFPKETMSVHSHYPAYQKSIFSA